MAPRPNKRLITAENKLLKLEELELKDVSCPICQSILVEPVTLPCFHNFCLLCFKGSVENNALCCPLCRLRIGSWLRYATKRNDLVNISFWSFIQSKFSEEINKKSRGEDLLISQETPSHALSKEGEIKSEYEEELKKLKAERLHLENKNLLDSKNLIKKLQEEEEQALNDDLKRLKQDEIIARQMQQELSCSSYRGKNNNLLKNRNCVKSKKIEDYLLKINDKPLKINKILENDITKDSQQVSTDCLRIGKNRKINNTKPILCDQANSIVFPKVGSHRPDQKNVDKIANCPVKTKIQSLPVSLPYTKFLRLKLQEKLACRENESSSADSMRQELCHFKPINPKTPNNFEKNIPFRVPGLHNIAKEINLPKTIPSREQYLQGLWQLRKNSFEENTPSAFVLMIKILKRAEIQSNKNYLERRVDSNRSPDENSKNRSCSYSLRNGLKRNRAANIKRPCRRRTRSMGSIKDENETTPKKPKIKTKNFSERKHYLRSDNKKPILANGFIGHSPNEETFNNNTINLAVKNLSTSLEKCEVKKILEKQMQIQKVIEQEKRDYELACKLEAELNGKRQSQRTILKRQVTLNYMLRPLKNVKA